MSNQISYQLDQSEYDKNFEYCRDQFFKLLPEGDDSILALKAIFFGLSKDEFDIKPALEKYASEMSLIMSSDIAKRGDYKNLPLGKIKYYIDCFQDSYPSSIYEACQEDDKIKGRIGHFTVSSGISESLPRYNAIMEKISDEAGVLFKRPKALESAGINANDTIEQAYDKYQQIDENRINAIQCEETLQDLIKLGKDLRKLL